MNIIVGEVYGTHDGLEVFVDSFKSVGLILFTILFFIGFAISKKMSKKTFSVNNTIYLLLGIFYLIISIIKAYILSNLPPHDLGKDFCGIGYSLIQTIIMYHIPIIYTIMLLAMLADKKKDKRRDKK